MTEWVLSVSTGPTLAWITNIITKSYTTKSFGFWSSSVDDRGGFSCDVTQVVPAAIGGKN